MLHIVAIIGSLVFDFQCISSVDLGPSGEPRENAVGTITFSFPDQIRLIYTLGGKQKDVLTKVLLPGSVPLIISNMKVNIGLCLVGVIIGEFLAAKQGLGYLIIYGSQVFQMDMVVMSIILLCIMSAALYQGVGILGKFLQQQYHQH